MEEKNYGTIRTEMIESLRAENKALKDENAELSQKVEWLMEQLRLLKKKQFGSSSEQSKEQLDGQLSFLFNKSEAYTALLGPQPSRSPAKRVRLGEEGQGSGMRNARRAFRIRADFAPTRWSTV